MLHPFSLLPLLLAPAPSSDGFAAAVPDDTFLAIHAPNPRALITLRDSNDWVAFMLDRDWDRVVRTLLDAMGDDVTADEVIEWRDRVAGALGESTEALVFIAGDFATNEPTTGLFVRGGEECSSLLRAFLGSDAVPHTIAGGRSVLISEAGRGELFYEHDGVILVLSSPTIAGACTVAGACLDALDAGRGPAGPFAIEGIARERAAARVGGEPAFEVAADMGRVWSSLESIERPREGFEQRAFDALASIDWAYGRASFGAGESAEWSLVAPYGVDSLLGGLLSHCGEADAGRLDTVPASAGTAAVVAFDVAGCAEWVLQVLGETSEDAREVAESALRAAKATLGIDVLDDVLRNMTGQLVYFSTPNPIRIGNDTFAGAQAPTIVVELRDADPFIDLVEQVIDLAGLGTNVEWSEAPVAGADDALETWRVSGDDLIAFGAAAGAGRLALSLDVDGFEEWLELVATSDAKDGLLADPKLRAALAGLEGTGILIQPTAASADALESMVASFESLAREIDPFSNEASAEVTALTEAATLVAGLVRKYFQGTTTGELRVGDGLVRVQVRAR